MIAYISDFISKRIDKFSDNNESLKTKIINAEGEFQAASKLAEASVIIEKHPTALQLRYLQTMNEMAAESNSTTFFPLPLDLLRVFMDKRIPSSGDREKGE